MSALLRCLRRDDGVAAIEFCLALPILLLLTAGAYDVSRLITARIDYQQALTETAGLALAQPPQADFTYLVNAAAKAARVPASSVVVKKELRCNNVTVATLSCPNTADERAVFVSIKVTGSYTPIWTHLAIGRTTSITMTRTVRVQ